MSKFNHKNIRGQFENIKHTQAMTRKGISIFKSLDWNNKKCLELHVKDTHYSSNMLSTKLYNFHNNFCGCNKYRCFMDTQCKYTSDFSFDITTSGQTRVIHSMLGDWITSGAIKLRCDNINELHFALLLDNDLGDIICSHQY